MQSMLETIVDKLSGDNLSSLSHAVGMDEKATRSALASALPMILAGLARNTAKPEGAVALDQALDRDHDGSLLDDVSGFLKRGDTTPGEGILGHVFGNRRSAVEAGVGRSSGIDPAKAAKLLAMAAPLIMAALARRKRESAMDSTALGRVLAEQNQDVQKKAPSLGGLARLLDADGDGSITDDIAAGVGKLFGR